MMMMLMVYGLNVYLSSSDLFDVVAVCCDCWYVERGRGRDSSSTTTHRDQLEQHTQHHTYTIQTDDVHIECSYCEIAVFNLHGSPACPLSLFLCV